jgi:tRNA threonylcarbamoyladenosine biosynthesis protein TsaB
MLLGIDTCGAVGTVALAHWEDGAVSPVAQAELAGKTYSAQLVPKIQELLEERGLSPRDIEAVVVVHGPGSFTGVRIGVSSAKALAEAREIPLIAVSRLAVLEHKARAEAAALDAGRGEFYFRAQGHEELLTRQEINDRVTGIIAVCEDNAVLAFQDALRIDPPNAADALIYAVPRLVARDFDDVAAVDGNYVRRSDAEIFAKQKVQAAAKP